MSGTTIYWTTLSIPDRKWRLLATEEGVCRLLFPHEPLETVIVWLERWAPGYTLVEDGNVFEHFGVIKQLEAYFHGRQPSFEAVPMMLWGTPFQRAVWSELGRIPYGMIRTYQEVATAIGRPQAVRAVGAANGANPLPVLLACHRVVGADRTLTGYRGGLQIKQELLKLEGVTGIEPAGHARFLF